MSYKRSSFINNGIGIYFDPQTPGFVRYSSSLGELGRILLTTGIQHHGGNEQLQGSPINLLSATAAGTHISWLSNELRSNTGVFLLAITDKPYSEVTVDDLIARSALITSRRLPAPGPEHVFAVKVGSADPYLAKVRVYKPSPTEPMHAEWVTYDIRVARIIGEGYDNPQDVKFEQETTDFGPTENAYVSDWSETANTWELAKVLGAEGRFDKDFYDSLVSGSGLPGQIALTRDDVFVIDENDVWMANKNGVGAAKRVVTELNGGRGLLVRRSQVNPQEITVYALTNNGTSWTLLGHDIDLGASLPVAASAMTTIASGTGAGGFLSFGFEDPSTVWFPRIDSSTLVRVDLPDTLGVVSPHDITFAAPNALPESMRSVHPGSPTGMFVLSDGEFGQVDFQVITGDLILGIGFVPFTKILQRGQPGVLEHEVGRAHTADDPGYFFRVDKVPFGGSIHLMINHRQARLNGAEFFQVTLATVNQTDSLDDYIWNSTKGIWEIRSTVSQVVGAAARPAYRLRNTDAELWYNPHRGCIINTRKVPDGLQTLTVTFLDAAGNPLGAAGAVGSRELLIDNANSSARLDLPVIGGVPRPLTCGCLQYASRSDSFVIDFSATHPRNEAQYTLHVVRADKLLPAPISDIDVPVLPVPGPKTLTVGDVLGDCNVVNMRVSLYVPIRVTTGHGWAYTGAQAHRYFTLVPDTVALDE